MSTTAIQPLPLAEAMKRAYAQIPVRLQEIDREMMAGEKESVVVHATRAGSRFRIEISKRISMSKERRFVAVCFADGKKHRYYGDKPSTAFGRLVGGSLMWTATRMQFERHSPEK